MADVNDDLTFARVRRKIRVFATAPSPWPSHLLWFSPIWIYFLVKLLVLISSLRFCSTSPKSREFRQKWQKSLFILRCTFVYRKSQIHHLRVAFIIIIISFETEIKREESESEGTVYRLTEQRRNFVNTKHLLTMKTYSFLHTYVPYTISHHNAELTFLCFCQLAFYAFHWNRYYTNTFRTAQRHQIPHSTRIASIHKSYRCILLQHIYHSILMAFVFYSSHA